MRHQRAPWALATHAMAAGLSLQPADLARFAEAFAAVIAERLGGAALEPVLHSDGALAPGEFCRALAESLRQGGPWGQACPEPVFDGEFAVEEWRCVGRDHLRMRLRVPDGGAVPAIHFGGWTGTAAPSTVRLAFQLEPDDWQGGDGVQLLVRHCEPA